MLQVHVPELKSSGRTARGKQQDPNTREQGPAHWTANAAAGDRREHVIPEPLTCMGMNEFQADESAEPGGAREREGERGERTRVGERGAGAAAG